MAEEDFDEFDEEDDDDGQGGSKALTKKLEELKARRWSSSPRCAATSTRCARRSRRKATSRPPTTRRSTPISDELMTIRFTVKTIERLCDILRSQVDDVRRYEREIRKIVVDKCGMPQDHFIKTFPPNALNLKWAEKEIAAGKPYSVDPDAQPARRCRSCSRS